MSKTRLLSAGFGNLTARAPPVTARPREQRCLPTRDGSARPQLVWSSRGRVPPGSVAVPAVVGDVPLLEVELVQQCLAVKEVVEGLCPDLEQAGPAAKEAPPEPGGDPACGRHSALSAGASTGLTKQFYCIEEKKTTFKLLYLPYLYPMFIKHIFVF